MLLRTPVTLSAPRGCDRDDVPDALASDDRLALGNLVIAYAEAVDTRAFDRLADVFTPDAVLDTGQGERHGVDEIVSAMERLRRYESTSHLLGQRRFTGGPDEAEGVTHCEAHHLLVDGPSRTDRVMHVRYLDRFVRTGGRWRIASRVLEIVRTHDRAVTSPS